MQVLTYAIIIEKHFQYAQSNFYFYFSVISNVL
jgi:hypothetical protein